MAANRSVDEAMSADRPEKQTVRSFWLREAKNYDSQHSDEDVPLYLTLPGAEAKDITLLAEHDLIERAETGGIAEKSMGKVVAVERSSEAAGELQLNFPGLPVKQMDFKGLVSGNAMTRFPTGEDEKYCGARVVNLDLNSELIAVKSGSEHQFPVLRWIKKLCVIHAERRLGWCLCLTLNANISWSSTVIQKESAFLSENFDAFDDFEESCYSIWGGTFHSALRSGSISDLSQLSDEKRQRLLMAFVPKKIASQIQNDGWKFRTSENLCYGSAQRGSAPMVTWIFSFERDPLASVRPQEAYRESILGIFEKSGFIGPNGEIDFFTP